MGLSQKTSIDYLRGVICIFPYFITFWKIENHLSLDDFNKQYFDDINYYFVAHS